jgi:prolyl oligopeptidase
VDRLARSIAWVLLLAGGCVSPRPPETPRTPVTDRYHGVEVVDDYRWLEDWSDASVRAWSESQNARARELLDRLPAAAEIRERVGEILRSESTSYRALDWAAGTLFAIENRPPKEQPFLVAMASPDDPGAARVLVDPNAIDPSGATTIDWYVPSFDAKHVAVSLSVGGSESGDLHVFDTATGARVGEVIPHVNNGTAGGDLAWTPDGAGFFYTRYPRPGERPEEDAAFYQQVWFHRLGTPVASDVYELGESFPRVAEIRLQTDPSSGRVLATMQDGDSGRFEHHLRGTDGDWTRLTRYEDHIVQARMAPDGTLFMISRRDAPRGKILRLPAGGDDLAASKTIVEEGADTLVSDFYGSPPMIATAELLCVTYQLGGPSTIRCFDPLGQPRPGPEVPPVSSVGRIVALSDGSILFHDESYTVPDSWLHFDPRRQLTRDTALSSESPVDFSGIEVTRELAVSRDGTPVPVTILRPVGTALDGSNPTILTGYGGYGINVEPSFDPVTIVWLERGGVLAVANLRGGGEFGEQWHRDGMLTRKQNVFDDFSAAMRHLIDRRYTSPERLAIRGGSNGGLLMGAMIAQHPELCRAVVSSVGIYDMLRVELSPNGAFNVPEFGTVDDLDQFRALYAYSPYHNVRDGVPLPAVLLMTGANDPRVDPMQSRKMAARLQAATTSGRPILLRTSGNTGHGGGTPLSARVEELTDVYAFLFSELGVTGR